MRRTGQAIKSPSTGLRATPTTTNLTPGRSPWPHIQPPASSQASPTARTHPLPSRQPVLVRWVSTRMGSPAIRQLSMLAASGIAVSCSWSPNAYPLEETGRRGSRPAIPTPASPMPAVWTKPASCSFSETALRWAEPGWKERQVVIRTPANNMLAAVTASATYCAKTSARRSRESGKQGLKAAIRIRAFRAPAALGNPVPS